MVPPTEEIQAPLLKFRQLPEAFTVTFVPSGTMLPAESLIPEKVIDAVPPPDKEMEDGPDAVADVVPCSRMVPMATATFVSVLPVLEAGTTETRTVCVSFTPAERF